MLQTIYGRITAITPDNGLVRITVTNLSRDVDLYVGPKSLLVRKAEYGLAQGIGQQVHYRQGWRRLASGKRRPGERVRCFQMVALAGIPPRMLDAEDARMLASITH